MASGKWRLDEIDRYITFGKHTDLVVFTRVRYEHPIAIDEHDYELHQSRQQEVPKK
jgi:hypothetical protein